MTSNTRHGNGSRIRSWRVRLVINTAIAMRLQRNRIRCCSVWHLKESCIFIRQVAPLSWYVRFTAIYSRQLAGSLTEQTDWNSSAWCTMLLNPTVSLHTTSSWGRSIEQISFFSLIRLLGSPWSGIVNLLYTSGKLACWMPTVCMPVQLCLAKSLKPSCSFSIPYCWLF